MDPIEWIFRVIVGGIGFLIAMAFIFGWLIPLALMIVGVQVGIIVAVVGYIVGIPWAIWFRMRHGFWPSAD